MSGLYFYNARYYDAGIGRFVSPDTVMPELGKPQGFSRFSYVINNPLRYTDPSGLRFICEDDDDSSCDILNANGNTDTQDPGVEVPLPVDSNAGDGTNEGYLDEKEGPDLGKVAAWAFLIVTADFGVCAPVTLVGIFVPGAQAPAAYADLACTALTIYGLSQIQSELAR